MLNLTVFTHEFWTEYLFLNRAKFVASVVNGIRVSFFNNLIGEQKQ
ncbi:RAxF-45 family protein [Oceanobacillus neutriphilus]|uniref:Uncharacterized protein n=1 Tax=Oceanobacillus neutriphilus TaxID=531815 RepID=A0ABQ2NUA3_9BACI|nr:RAxF-45 family protein [Oceanobacillus neutriphilus]GGP10697.1 hypothetical protein GCM10011346_19860 [Oceanobacillus neutriphilus]